MRLRRPSNLLVASLSLSLVLAASACAPGGEASLEGGLGPSPDVGESTIAPAADVDDLALRAPGADSATGAGQGAVTARPSPPTLSTGADPAAAGDEREPASSVEPAISSTTTPTTAATASPSQPVTTAQPVSTMRSETLAPSSSSNATPEQTIASSGPPEAAADLGVGEARSFTLLEDLRFGLGLNGLNRDATMDAFARDWSRQMAESGRFEHSTAPYGENIAFTSNTQLSASEAAELFHRLWLDSPGHYANMTNDGYLTAGIGIYLTERGWYGTHVFSF